MIEVAVCDDDCFIANEIEERILLFAQKLKIEVETEVFFSGNSLLDQIHSGKRYDIIFLDIEMNEKDGIQTAKELRAYDKESILIYVTGYSEYAIEAYEVHPYQFLVKPIDYMLLEKYFNEAYKLIQEKDVYFQYKYNREYYKINVNQILYFESRKRKILIKTVDGNEHIFYEQLNIVEKILHSSRSSFWRIHQSFLVNSKYIYRVSYSNIELTNGMILNISEDRRLLIAEKYCDLLEGRIIN